MNFPWIRGKRGSAPDGFEYIVLHDDYPLHTYQNQWSWPWPPAPAHEQRSALVNNWTGNQLPGDVNFIPGVGGSKFLWNVPTSYMNSLKNQQYNVGFNIQGASSMQNAAMQAAIQQAWQNRTMLNG